MNRTEAINLVNEIYQLRARERDIVQRLNRGLTAQPIVNLQFTGDGPANGRDSLTKRLVQPGAMIKKVVQPGTGRLIEKKAARAPLATYKGEAKPIVYSVEIGKNLKPIKHIDQPTLKTRKAAMASLINLLKNNPDKAFTSGEAWQAMGQPDVTTQTIKNYLDLLRKQGKAKEALPKKEGRFMRFSLGYRLADKSRTTGKSPWLARTSEKSWLPAKGSIVERTWFYMNDHPGVIYSPIGLAKEMGEKPSTIRGHLLALTNRGLVRRVGEGNYVSDADITAPGAAPVNSSN